MSGVPNGGSVPVYQIDLEPDSGVNLTSGEEWTGWRVRYRPLGSRGRWSRFLTDADLTELDIEQLQDVCRKHAEMAA